MTWPQPGPSLNDFGGDWRAYEAHCNGVFERDFAAGNVDWPEPGVRFSIKRAPMVDGLSATFVHITTEGAVESERVPDFDRYARIEWPRQLIDEFSATFPQNNSKRVIWWRTERRNESRLLIALHDFSYVVVVAERSGYVLLWTAFPVERSHRRRRMQQEHDAYWRRP